MKRPQFEIGDWQEGQRRLDHYNAWLMDPKREFGKPYPGYPEDKNDSYLEPVKSRETVQEAPVFKGKKSNKINKLQRRKVTVALSGDVSHNKQTEQLKGYMMTKVTNLSKATEIVKSSATKAEALEKIVAELAVSRSNAFVYYTKASKALNMPKAEKSPKAEKVEKTAKVRTSKVTEITAEKAAKKVAEIDKVIANLKKTGATASSPFAQSLAIAGLTS